MSNTTLENSSQEYSLFSNVNWTNGTSTNTTLLANIFSNSTFLNYTFSNATVSYNNFESVNLTNVSIFDSNLTNVSLSGDVFSNYTFSGDTFNGSGIWNDTFINGTFSNDVFENVSWFNNTFNNYTYYSPPAHGDIVQCRGPAATPPVVISTSISTTSDAATLVAYVSPAGASVSVLWGPSYDHTAISDVSTSNPAGVLMTSFDLPYAGTAYPYEVVGSYSGYVTQTYAGTLVTTGKDDQPSGTNYVTFSCLGGSITYQRGSDALVTVCSNQGANTVSMPTCGSSTCYLTIVGYNHPGFLFDEWLSSGYVLGLECRIRVHDSFRVFRPV